MLAALCRLYHDSSLRSDSATFVCPSAYFNFLIIVIIITITSTMPQPNETSASNAQAGFISLE